MRSKVGDRLCHRCRFLAPSSHASGAGHQNTGNLFLGLIQSSQCSPLFHNNGYWVYYQDTVVQPLALSHCCLVRYKSHRCSGQCGTNHKKFGTGSCAGINWPNSIEMNAASLIYASWGSGPGSESSVQMIVQKIGFLMEFSKLLETASLGWESHRQRLPRRLPGPPLPVPARNAGRTAHLIVSQHYCFSSPDGSQKRKTVFVLRMIDGSLCFPS